MTAPAAPTDSELRRFIAAVPRGSANAITAAELCHRLGYVERGRIPTDNDKRVIRNLREHAYTAGVVVLGDNSGYFIPTSLEDGERAFGRRLSQAHDMIDGVRSEREALARMLAAGGQLALPL